MKLFYIVNTVLQNDIYTGIPYYISQYSLASHFLIVSHTVDSRQQSVLTQIIDTHFVRVLSCTWPKDGHVILLFIIFILLLLFMCQATACLSSALLRRLFVGPCIIPVCVFSLGVHVSCYITVVSILVNRAVLPRPIRHESRQCWAQYGAGASVQDTDSVRGTGNNNKATGSPLKQANSGRVNQQAWVAAK